MWAGLILRGGGVTNLLIDCGDAADSILLDMPKLWEAAVRRMVDDATGPAASIVSVAGGSGIIASGDLRIHKPFRPDVLVARQMEGRSTHFPIDAKYKHYDRSSLSADDIQQLLLYVTAYSPKAGPVGAIVHPHPRVNSHRSVRVHGNHRELGTIEVLGIATDLPPLDAVEWMRGVLLTIDPTLPTAD
jgi:5-methylcytosine-specific restriction enzyme subunit McrC